MLRELSSLIIIGRITASSKGCLEDEMTTGTARHMKSAHECLQNSITHPNKNSSGQLERDKTSKEIRGREVSASQQGAGVVVCGFGSG